jgi:WD40 repeat protein
MDQAQLRKCRQQLYQPMPLIGGWLQNQALRNLADDGSLAAVRLLGRAVVDSAEKSLKEAAFAALKEIASDGNIPAREAICELASHHNHVAARKVAWTSDYLPRDAQERALFLFLTNQWEEYEALDVDHRLLRSAYDSADAKLRARIAARARAAGRFEYVDMVAGGKQSRRMAEMTDAEWTASLDLLERGQRWDELWRLAQNAPPCWSVPLLRKLRHASRISNAQERKGCVELIRLARTWKRANFDTFMVHRATLEGHSRDVRCLTFDHAGSTLASGSSDGSVRLWEMPDGKPRAVLSGHRGWVNHLAITPDNGTLVSAARDGRICLWRLHDGKRLRKKKVHVGAIFGVAVTPQGDLLATGGADRLVKLWSLPRTTLLATMKKHRAAISCLAISPNGAYLASGGADSDVCIWSLPAGKLMRTLEEHRDETNDGILALTFSPDGRLLASSGTDGAIRLWSVPSGRQVKNLRTHTGSAGTLAFTPNSKFLISAGSDYAIQLWDVQTGQNLASVDASLATNACVAVSQKGDFLLTSGASGNEVDHTIRIWDLREQRVVRSLSGHQRGITSMALGQGDRLLASGSGDSTIRIWSAELARLEETPAAQLTLRDLESANKLLAQELLTETERLHLEFVAALLRWRMRLDIVIGDAAPKVIELGEFDIEIEG